MKTIVCLVIVVTGYGAVALSVRQQLARNVNRYKESNFMWNKRNFNTANFVSLRELEEKKDNEFIEYQRRQQRYGSTNDHMEYKDKEKRQIKELGQPRLMCYGNCIQPNTKFYDVNKEQETENDLQKNLVSYPKRHKDQTPWHVMLYSGDKPPQVMVYNAKRRDNPKPRYVMMYSTDIAPQVMMYNAQPDQDNLQPLSMMYEKQPPQVMMYNAKREDKTKSKYVLLYNRHMQPLAMRYNQQSVLYNLQPLSMMYENKPLQNLQPLSMMYEKQPPLQNLQPLSMMYENPKLKYIMTYKRDIAPRLMKYNQQSFMYNLQPLSMMYEYQPPQVMRYNAQSVIDNLQPLSMMYENQPPQVMMYNAKREDNPKPKYVMTYKRDIAPRVMRYNEQSFMHNLQPLSMMYENKPLQNLQPLSMMYENQPPQVMRYNAQSVIDNLQPLSMMYGNEPPQVMKYNNQREDEPHTRHVMMYSGEKLESQANVYNAQISVDNPQPLPMMFRKRSPQVTRYNASVEQDGTIQISKQSKSKLTWKKQSVKSDFDQWFKTTNTFIKSVPRTKEIYFRHWKQTISIFGDDDLTRQYFKLKFPAINLTKVIQSVSASNIFEKLFWPFVYQNGVMNQKLGLVGLSGRSVKSEQQKLEFYDVLEKYQTLRIPVAKDKIVYSFNDPEVVDALNRSGLQEMSKEYVNAGFHMYTPNEQTDIIKKVEAAMNLINNTMPELYKAIHQVVACIAFYKAEYPGYAGGTVSSALGLIWQDPRAYREQSVAHYAEQIVHEFIHTSLFLADLVHGTFTDFNLLPMAKVYSPIRHELRDFDKTFHASYVSTGVALFHARAGNWDKARKLAEPLKTSVDGLMILNNEIGVLNESGTAMLQAMADFLTVIRLM